MSVPRPVPAAENVAAAKRAVRPGVIYGLGALLLVVNAYFGTFAYVVVQAILWTQTSLQRGPVVMLTLLVAFNLTMGRIAKRKFALSRQELLILYSMLCMGTCVGGYGFVQQMINQLVAPLYFANPGNHFVERILPNVPTWLAPHDPAVYNGYFRGNTTLYKSVYLTGWAIPVLCWSAFIVAIFWVLFCVTALVRRSWVEEERLTFPLVLLPLEMTDTQFDGDNRVPFWKNRWMWAGFPRSRGCWSRGTSSTSSTLRSRPLPIKPSMGPNHLEQFLTARPWNAVGTLTLAFYPSMRSASATCSRSMSRSPVGFCTCWARSRKCRLLGDRPVRRGRGRHGESRPVPARAGDWRVRRRCPVLGVSRPAATRRRVAIAGKAKRSRRPGDELMPYRTALIGGAHRPAVPRRLSDRRRALADRRRASSSMYLPAGRDHTGAHRFGGGRGVGVGSQLVARLRSPATRSA